MPAPRCRPTASISSMKTIAGAFSFACSNKSRTRDAPTPTNISTKSEPEIEKNGTPASPATARASSVLPVPGGPYSNTPFGILAPTAWNFAGSARNSLISSSSSIASSHPATSRKVVFGVSLHRVQEEEEQHSDDDERDQRAQQRAEEAGRGVLALPLIQGFLGHPLIETGDQLVTLIADPGCLVAGLLRVLQGDADFLFLVDQDDLAQRLVAVDDRDHLRGRRFLESASHALTEVDQQTDRDHRKDDPGQRRAEYPS